MVQRGSYPFFEGCSLLFFVALLPLKLNCEMDEIPDIRNMYGLYGIYIYVRFIQRIYT